MKISTVRGWTAACAIGFGLGFPAHILLEQLAGGVDFRTTMYLVFGPVKDPVAMVVPLRDSFYTGSILGLLTFATILGVAQGNGVARAPAAAHALGPIRVPWVPCRNHRGGVASSRDHRMGQDCRPCGTDCHHAWRRQPRGRASMAVFAEAGLPRFPMARPLGWRACCQSAHSDSTFHLSRGRSRPAHTLGTRLGHFRRFAGHCGRSDE